MTNELRPETVLQLLVDQVSGLLEVEAADCYLYAPDGRMLRCAAVHGLDQASSASSSPRATASPGGRSREGTAVAEHDYESISDPVPNPAYDDFVAAMVAPMTWAGETRGVLGVGTRDGAAPSPMPTPMR